MELINYPIKAQATLSGQVNLEREGFHHITISIRPNNWITRLLTRCLSLRIVVTILPLFKGKIAMIKCWDRRLSTTEIQELYEQEKLLFK